MQVIIEFIQLLISGVIQVFSFVATMPQLVSTMITAFPPVLYTVLLLCFGIILAIRVLELLP